MNGLSGIVAKEAGDLLLEAGKITEPQLEQVRRRQRRLNLPQHRALVDKLIEGGLIKAGEEGKIIVEREEDEREGLPPVAAPPTGQRQARKQGE